MRVRPSIDYIVLISHIPTILQLCENQKCLNVTKLDVIKCPHCNGHGVCNAIGQCHCDAGWAPPHCDKSGGGGSLHSGPANEGGRKYHEIILLFIFFEGFSYFSNYARPIYSSFFHLFFLFMFW